MLKKLGYVAAILVALGRFAAADDIVWDGGTNMWNSGNWNGGLTAQSITGQNRGNGRIGDTFKISGADSVVEYYPPQEGGDFRPQQGVSYEITNGATLALITDASQDENSWTEYDGTALMIDGGTFRREGRSLSHPTRPNGDDGGGALIFGSWRSDDRVATLGSPVITIDVKNGGKVDNEGQFWFGSYKDHHPELKVHVNINNGVIDLHGGEIDLDNSGISLPGELIFTYKDSSRQEDYYIDFTGPGSITVDRSGIKTVEATASDFIVDENLSYKDLWDQGLLRSNGLSGLSVNPPNFADLFDVSGTPGQDDYRLTTKGFGGNPVDLNGDGAVDAADAGLMFADWGGPGSTSAADFNKDGFVDAADAGTMFADWTGDPAAPGANAATAEYNSVTGELKVSSAGAVNLFVQSAGSHITPLNPAPAVPVGLLTNNASRVGITNLGPINVSGFSFGNIGVGLAQSDLKLVYTPALGQKGIEVAAGSEAFKYIPEPASLSLLGLGVAGLLAGRRRG